MNTYGFVGIANCTKDLSKDFFILEDMSNALIKCNPDKYNYFSENSILFSERGFISSDTTGYNVPLSFKFNETTYTIVYNGKIYNSNKLIQELTEFGFDFDEFSDTEILLKSFVHWGKNMLAKINGVFSFAIWNNSNKELFVARDFFGIKPLYYTLINNNFIFASEIKSILKHPEVSITIDSSGICELIGLGPAHTPRNFYF